MLGGTEVRLLCKARCRVWVKPFLCSFPSSLLQPTEFPLSFTLTPWFPWSKGQSVRAQAMSTKKQMKKRNNSYKIKMSRICHLRTAFCCSTTLLSHFNWIRLTLKTAAHQASPSLGFSRQEHWSGLPFPSQMHESEKWKWSCSVVSDSSQPHGLQPTRLLHPWNFLGKSTGVGCHCLLH